MADAFYVQVDEHRFQSTDHTRGPWTPDAQHAGPPSSLIGRAIERATDRTDMQVVRITFEILKPIPVEELTVSAEVVRPGRNVELVEAELLAGETPIMKARAWRIRTTEIELDVVNPDLSPPPGPGAASEAPPFVDIGYINAMETRFVTGAFWEPGPATAWFRMRYPLIAGEEVTPLTRVLIAADSGNGISSAVDWREWYFINTDLSVHLHRMPVGEWVCLDAATTIETTGNALAASVISDEKGTIGRGLQSLFVAPR